MRQAERKKEKDKVAIALMLCFCVIALTSIFTIRANIDKIDGSNTQVPVSDQTKVDENQTDKQEDASNPVSRKAAADTPVIDSRDAETKKEQPSLTFQKPVNADDAYVTNEYAMDKLIYSVTLDQYMVHCGVDIEAPEDSQVLAVAGGTITAIYQDDRYGNSVELTLSDGFIAVYSNLSDASMVEVGDTVKAGDIIGGVGSTGLFESMEPAHLHLEMLKDGVYVNPMDYIKL